MNLTLMHHSEAMDRIFTEPGLLSETLAGYEPRPAQVDMARAVAAGLEGGALVVEAETGIGKTLAYLIPAVASGQKIVVSTNTLNLQEQILRREIPFILKHIDPTLKVVCVKGRQNYLCLHRWHQHLGALAAAQQRLPGHEQADLDNISHWLAETNSGDRAELTWLPDDSGLWRNISATANQCLGSQCPEDTQCFISRLRKQAAAARLLIVNHHLFFSDLALRRFGHGEVLPRYESVIFDEAHHLENIATRYFGLSCSHYQLIDLANDVEQLARTECVPAEQAKITRVAAALATRADSFSDFFPLEKGRFPLQDFIDQQPGWQAELEALESRITRLLDCVRQLALAADIWGAMVRRAEELLTQLKTITAVTDPDSGNDIDSLVRWYERRDRAVVLSASPIEVADELRQVLYDKVCSCIFTSATLGVDGRFTYFLDRLGLDSDTETLTLPSPFDFRNRTLLYIPYSPFPLPNHPEFLAATAERIIDLLALSRGRALVLFTSLQAMHHARRCLEGRLPYPVLCQGDAPKNRLLDLFNQQTNSVLLAVASFWEGVNVPGEALSCVIIDKLPFEVPSDPVIMARINRIKEEGGNPFMDFQIPRAILALRQGIGRLMRASTDRGLLAVLDTRLFGKRYGRLFLNSLPPSPVSRSLDEVAHFFCLPSKKQRGTGQ